MSKSQLLKYQEHPFCCCLFALFFPNFSVQIFHLGTKLSCIVTSVLENVALMFSVYRPGEEQK